ncbi:hypothetical protein N476_08390 [Pseudoalteromonas luteoviolacea H33]|uniref:Multidrug-efflux transporter n=2 Tax=Pseudoalteromonas luteoviolacea TaxID=43657 RepID=A0A167G7M4_9GAMM|nr:hypothetical protein N476_08390 [Pseudoalteromonas luteoviolacea H33]KZN78265.1 hypothetical protein N477_09135 [Pseudoalteromonas luteoviolacea H33-S]
MSVPIMMGMFVHTLNFMVELYFVGKLGSAALAGVGSVGVLVFFVLAATQVLNVGMGTLISHAVGRKDKSHANTLFNQGIFISILCMIGVIIFGLLLAPIYFDALAPDTATLKASLDYFYWFLPALALQFPITAIAAALRGTGVVKLPMLINIVAVILNMLLSPLLITGKVFGMALGVAGAALASSIAMALGFVGLFLYLKYKECYLGLTFKQCLPNGVEIKRIIGLGLPAGGELLFTFVYMSVIYWVLRDFDASAQAGFGVGVRVMQALFLPAMAVALAGPAIAGQNFASGNMRRVLNTYHQMAWMTCGLMLILNGLCVFYADIFITPFSNEQEVIVVATVFLSYVCFNFIPAGYVLTVSAMFKALGNVWPALLSTVIRLSLFSVPVITLSLTSTISLEIIWSISASSVYIQAVVSHFLLKRELYKKGLQLVSFGECKAKWPPLYRAKDTPNKSAS